ncbi:hypothetical protein [Minwuia thermotolerans]|uniref:hypothetical protein n=1 Tax=Minwuia thermotolerans TaxID=2056226 RepID=UPI000F62FD8F|nr:hypothetical protein [Minwuia thermotolerans]
MENANPDFDRSVFLNCPFDEDYRLILRNILFCLVYCDMVPRIASEDSDSGKHRLDKILHMIESCKFSIHDLSRCRATTAGEISRMNMPFELGLDFGCKQFYGYDCDSKKILILESEKYQYQKSISDIGGCDVLHHENEPGLAVRRVRDWLRGCGISVPAGADAITGKCLEFDEWNYDKLSGSDFTDDDIDNITIPELIENMQKWKELSK